MKSRSLNYGLNNDIKVLKNDTLQIGDKLSKNESKVKNNKIGSSMN